VTHGAKVDLSRVPGMSEHAYLPNAKRRGCDENGQTIKDVSGGEFFGERALLSDKTWHFTATATEESTLIGLGSEEF
jgi:hypothetical protein